MMRKIVFAMTGALGVPGGVSEVNLAILHVLVGLQQKHGIEFEVMSFAENDAERPSFLPDRVSFRGYSKNKTRFAMDLVRRVSSRPLYFIDYVRLASPLIPFVAAALTETIIFAHGNEYWKNMRFSDKVSIRLANRVLTNSDYTLQRMKQTGIPFSGVSCPLGLSTRTVLNPSVPQSLEASISFQACDGRVRDLGPQVLLLVARINRSERYKGHYPLLKIMPELLRYHPEVQLVFPGPGDDHEGIAQYARAQGVADSVFLPGYISRERLEDLYCLSYAFVMPSTCEGFGLVHLEAMNYAKPCIGCFDDGAADVIVHGETGYLVKDPDDISGLSEAVIRLLDDPEYAAELGRAGFDRLHARFTAEQFYKRVHSELIRCL